ncbi:MAG: aminomethyl-transferring glycine dehydrogenase subunit GcvPB, partial [Candidatus Poseidoniales archaeon]
MDRGEQMSDLFAFNGAKGAGWAQPKPSIEREILISLIPKKLRRKSLPKWPRASEPEIVRHYTWLSNRNFGIDNGFYPLGS